MFAEDALKNSSSNPKLKTIYTGLPDSVKLTRKQSKELLAFEKLFSDFSASDLEQLNPLLEQFEIQSTDNAGLHYFCLEHDVGLLHLSYNPNLFADAYMLVFEKAKLFTELLDTSSICFALLDNSAVIRNPTLFRMTFETMRNMDPSFDIFKLVSTKALEGVDIDIFMEILDEAGCNKHDTAKSRFARVALTRELEVREWASWASPDFKDLPLSWLLRAHGIPSTGAP